MSCFDLPLAAIKPFRIGKKRVPYLTPDESRRRIEDYAELLQWGLVAPAILVEATDQPGVWKIFDGMHRTRAAQMLGRETIRAVDADMVAFEMGCGDC